MFLYKCSFSAIYKSMYKNQNYNASLGHPEIQMHFLFSVVVKLSIGCFQDASLASKLEQDFLEHPHATIPQSSTFQML